MSCGEPAIETHHGMRIVRWLLDLRLFVDIDEERPPGPDHNAEADLLAEYLDDGEAPRRIRESRGPDKGASSYRNSGRSRFW